MKNCQLPVHFGRAGMLYLIGSLLWILLPSWSTSNPSLRNNPRLVGPHGESSLHGEVASSLHQSMGSLSGPKSQITEIMLHFQVSFWPFNFKNLFWIWNNYLHSKIPIKICWLLESKTDQASQISSHTFFHASSALSFVSQGISRERGLSATLSIRGFLLASVKKNSLHTSCL